MLSDVDDSAVGLAFHGVAGGMEARDVSFRDEGAFDTTRVNTEFLLIIRVIDLIVSVTAISVPEWLDMWAVVETFIGTTNIRILKVPKLHWNRGGVPRHAANSLVETIIATS
jgi:hypothetical protein